MQLDTYCRFHKCERQGGVLAHPAHLDEGGPYLLQLLALVTHTTWPHGNSHPLDFHMDGKPIYETGEHEFRIVCTHENCDRPPKERLYHIEAPLAGSCAIAFHAEHEGHALALYWDGKRIHPPEDSK